MTIQNSSPVTDTNTSKLTTAEIQVWLVSYLAELLEIAPEQIDVKTTFDRYGLDSSAAIALLSDLSDRTGLAIDPDTLHHHPTIESLANYLGNLEETLL